MTTAYHPFFILSDIACLSAQSLFARSPSNTPMGIAEAITQPIIQRVDFIKPKEQ